MAKQVKRKSSLKGDCKQLSKSKLLSKSKPLSQSKPLSEKESKIVAKQLTNSNIRCLKDIILHHHADSIKCSQCNFRAMMPESIELHQIVHVGACKDIKSCQLCSYETDRPCSFNRHILTHNDDKPHVCYDCDKEFFDRRDLKKHIRNVHATGIKEV